ncbi:hypothetical protein [Mucilaginibacter celer]|uniref:DUF4345 domain-containing protein n=1 Tax=Mucilaginibacter celer TaxID=2305508 RepID=A0A494VPQ1_9SPHI|nr:hypothetical protein [Mucilaginibacter celer]AYL96754.1 hypothetical protein HYN43_016235 [Mucilaginibacter celer]
MNIQSIIRLAGFAQIALVLGSFAIPGILNWRGELVKVQILIRQMFWTYAAYILVINLCFGLVSALCYNTLVNGSLLAMLLCGFIAVYWISRVLIQFFYFDRGGFPMGIWPKLCEAVLVMLFVFLGVVYSWAAYINYLQN